ncbi:hypothetical protein [Shewanella halifaxensis]|nr:hypothetical protein [Shewanella halifaxensis]
MEVYNAKEGFLAMWDMPTRKDAEEYWEHWKSVSNANRSSLLQRCDPSD